MISESFCQCCGRKHSELPWWHLGSAPIKLIRDYRNEGNGQIGVYFSCHFCFGLPNKQYFKLLRTEKLVGFGHWLDAHSIPEEMVTNKHLRVYRRLCESVWQCPNCSRVNTSHALLCECALERLGP
jgi:hypothetical protein